MNANELANELEKINVYWDLDEEELNQAATMLRQQQAEIEALKLQLHTTLTNRDLRTYDGKTEINNEPLAWALRKAQEK
jgi:tagatose-1,6-bisphosphate aldolase